MFGIGTFSTKPSELILWVDTPWVKERRVLFYIYEPLRFGVGVSFVVSVHAVVRMWVHETYGMRRFTFQSFDERHGVFFRRRGGSRCDKDNLSKLDKPVLPVVCRREFAFIQESLAPKQC